MVRISRNYTCIDGLMNDCANCWIAIRDDAEISRSCATSRSGRSRKRNKNKSNIIQEKWSSQRCVDQRCFDCCIDQHYDTESDTSYETPQSGKSRMRNRNKSNTRDEQLSSRNRSYRGKRDDNSLREMKFTKARKNGSASKTRYLRDDDLINSLIIIHHEQKRREQRISEVSCASPSFDEVQSQNFRMDTSKISKLTKNTYPSFVTVKNQTFGTDTSQESISWLGGTDFEKSTKRSSLQQGSKVLLKKSKDKRKISKAQIIPRSSPDSYYNIKNRQNNEYNEQNESPSYPLPTKSSSFRSTSWERKHLNEMIINKKHVKNPKKYNKEKIQGPSKQRQKLQKKLNEDNLNNIDHTKVRKSSKRRESSKVETKDNPKLILSSNRQENTTAPKILKRNQEPLREQELQFSPFRQHTHNSTSYGMSKRSSSKRGNLDRIKTIEIVTDGSIKKYRLKKDRLGKVVLKEERVCSRQPLFNSVLSGNIRMTQHHTECRSFIL